MVLRTPSTSPALAYVENDASHFDAIVFTSRLAGMTGLPSLERVGKAASGMEDVGIFTLSNLWRMGGGEGDSLVPFS